jgi:2-dehydro-3-deoxyphosphogalactonate aldolase
MTFDEALNQCGVIAILRGVTPDEVVPVSQALYDAGLRVVEVPLNSPDPFMSIQRLAKAFAGKMVVGAGTVLSPQDANLLKEHGGTICISPDCNPDVIARAVALGMEAVPGVFTPTEAFAAIRAGAKHLKLFPAEAASPTTIKAWKAVLPKHVKLHAVGGITPSNMQDWLKAGATGFGVGSNLYKSGKSIADITKDAKAFAEAYAIARKGLL